MMPPPGCSPNWPSHLTSSSISRASIVIGLLITLPKLANLLESRRDFACFDALVARRVELAAQEVVWQVGLRPATRVVLREIVAVAILAAVAHAAHQPGHGV